MSMTSIEETWWPILENLGATKNKNGWLCEYAARHAEMENDAFVKLADVSSGVSLLPVALKIGLGIKKAQECTINFEGVTETHSMVYDIPITVLEELRTASDNNMSNGVKPLDIVKIAEDALVESAIEFINSKINEVKLKSPGEQVYFNVGSLANSMAVITEKTLAPRLYLTLNIKIGSASYDSLLLEAKQEMGGDGAVGTFVESFKNNIQRVVLEESKEYYWLRLYLREEVEIENGTIVKLQYLPTKESIDLIFIAYEKKGQNDQFYSDIIEYVKEDDKKVLCLMLDVKEVNSRTDIDMLQKILRCSRKSEETILRREDLPFVIKNDNDEWISLDYYDADF